MVNIDQKFRLVALDKRKRTLENIYYAVLGIIAFIIYAACDTITEQLVKTGESLL